jgi:hypothetical protein
VPDPQIITPIWFWHCNGEAALQKALLQRVKKDKLFCVMPTRTFVIDSDFSFRHSHSTLVAPTPRPFPPVIGFRVELRWPRAFHALGTAGRVH